MQDYYFYIFALVVIVVAFVLLKKVVSCLLKSVIMLAIIAALAYIYVHILYVFHAVVSSSKRRSKILRSSWGWEIRRRISFSFSSLGELGIHRRI